MPTSKSNADLYPNLPLIHTFLLTPLFLHHKLLLLLFSMSSQRISVTRYVFWFKQLSLPCPFQAYPTFHHYSWLKCLLFIRNPLAQMEEEKKEHELKMKKMEADMEQVFESKVSEKMQKLRDSEAEVSLTTTLIGRTSLLICFDYSLQRGMNKLPNFLNNKGSTSKNEKRRSWRNRQHLIWFIERWKTWEGHLLWMQIHESEYITVQYTRPSLVFSICLACKSSALCMLRSYYCFIVLSFVKVLSRMFSYCHVFRKRRTTSTMQRLAARFKMTDWMKHDWWWKPFILLNIFARISSFLVLTIIFTAPFQCLSFTTKKQPQLSLPPKIPPLIFFRSSEPKENPRKLIDFDTISLRGKHAVNNCKQMWSTCWCYTFSKYSNITNTLLAACLPLMSSNCLFGLLIDISLVINRSQTGTWIRRRRKRDYSNRQSLTHFCSCALFSHANVVNYL